MAIFVQNLSTLKKGFIYFWCLFLAYFAFVHPAIIYYAMPSEGDMGSRSAPLGFFYFGLAFLLWALVIAFLIRTFYRFSFGARRKMQHLQKEGIPVQAGITTVKDQGALIANGQEKTLELSFRNFAGTLISDRFQITDAQPERQRYERGKTVTLLIDPSLAGSPFACIRDCEPRLNTKKVLTWLLVILLLSLGVLLYFLWAYQKESLGYGWRFLSFWHPLILSPLILLGYYLLGYRLLLKSIFRKLGIGSDHQSLRLRYYGKMARAEVLAVSRTGTTINDQPEVRYKIRYRDEAGSVHEGELKKIVDLLDLGGIHAPTVDIFYLPEDPAQVAFAPGVVVASI